MDNSTVKKPQIQLKNKLAQEFMEQKTIIVDGYEIKLWTGHSHQNVRIQERWNAIKSYSLLNSCSDGSSGDIVLTGIMQIPRLEIAEYAINLGFRVHSSVSYNTDYLIFGSENVSPSKFALAIELNSKGANIQFVDELTFLQIIADNFDLVENENFENDQFKVVTEDISCLNKIIGKKEKNNFRLKSESKEEEKNIEIMSNKLLGNNIVISGTFVNHSREELKILIQQHGGKNLGSVSSNTSFILAGDNIGPEKLKKAKELGIKLIDETGYLLRAS